jgi:hypothetical protein
MKGLGWLIVGGIAIWYFFFRSRSTAQMAVTSANSTISDAANQITSLITAPVVPAQMPVSYVTPTPVPVLSAIVGKVTSIMNNPPVSSSPGPTTIDSSLPVNEEGFTPGQRAFLDQYPNGAPANVGGLTFMRPNPINTFPMLEA